MPLEVSLTTNTTTITHLNLSSLDEEQNKTRDPTKVLLRTVAPVSLSIRLIKNIPGSSSTRNFVWSSEDSPSTIVAKWKAQMRSTVSSVSFGHCDLLFDSTTIKFSAVYDQDLAYGSITDVFYQVDRDFGTDQAKSSLGLLLTNSPNIFWQTNMNNRPFPNTYNSMHTVTALVLPFNASIFETPLSYVSELKLSTDLETATTNSIGLQFTVENETPFIEGTVALIGDTLKLQTESSSNPLASTFTLKLRNLLLPDPLPVLSVLVKRNSLSPDVNFARWFYFSPADTPSQIIVKWNDQMRVFVDGNSFGHLTLSYDTTSFRFAPVFDYSTAYGTPEGFGWFSREDSSDASKDYLGMERSPSHLNPGWSAGPRPLSMSTWPLIFPYAAGYYFRTAGPTRLWWFIYNRGVLGRNYTANGTTIDVINSVERIEDTLYALQENINIASCTATSDSWLLTTNNPGGDVQLIVSSSYNPAAARNLTRESPTFIDNNTIVPNSDWPGSSMFTIVGSSALSGGSGHEPHRAFNSDTSTFWASGAGTYNTTGAGQQFITVIYPEAVELRSYRINPGTLLTSGTSAPIQWSISGSNTGGLFTVVDTFSTTAWVDNVSQTFIMQNQTALYKYWRITVTRNSVLWAIPSLNYWFYKAMQEDSFKRNAIDLTRASYLPLDQAGTFGESLGFKLDRQLSQADTLVYTDNRTGQPTIVHRGSTTPRDFLVDDALIAFGSGRETQRQRRAREITTAAEVKYKMPSNSTGHSLGGRLAERSGSRGSIVTFNKAAGLADIPNFNFTGRSQPQIQNGSRQTDVRTRLDPVSLLSSLGRRPSGQAPLVVVPQRDQANRFLPGPVRMFVNAARAHSLGNLKQRLGEYHPGSNIGKSECLWSMIVYDITDCYQREMPAVEMGEKMAEKTR
ncbi:hypothetical protein T492DRAFT_1123053 [Pavlovales sp. CCMP2436]|nr:hypothetical protein T492DRAFT_1123053 [Pavlovales sp. CCMP2436]